MAANLTERFHEGLDLAAAGEHAQASAVFAECVAGDPQDLEFVEALLKSLQKRLPTEGASDDLEHSLPESVRMAWQSKDWDKVRLQAPDVLMTDPGSVPALRALAEASAAQGRYDIELRYLE